MHWFQEDFTAVTCFFLVLLNHNWLKTLCQSLNISNYAHIAFLIQAAH